MQNKQSIMRSLPLLILGLSALLAEPGITDTNTSHPVSPVLTSKEAFAQAKKDIALINRKYLLGGNDPNVNEAVITLVDSIIDTLSPVLNEGAPSKRKRTAEELFESLSYSLHVTPAKPQKDRVDIATDEMIQEQFDTRKNSLSSVFWRFLENRPGPQIDIVYEITFHNSGLVDTVDVHRVEKQYTNIARAMIPIIYTIRIPKLSQRTKILYPIGYRVE